MLQRHLQQFFTGIGNLALPPDKRAGVQLKNLHLFQSCDHGLFCRISVDRTFFIDIVEQDHQIQMPQNVWFGIVDTGQIILKVLFCIVNRISMMVQPDDVMKNKKSVNKAMQQIRELPQDELVARDGALRKEKFLLRAQAKSGQLESPAKIRTARRNLARVMTELNKRASAGK